MRKISNILLWVLLPAMMLLVGCNDSDMPNPENTHAFLRMYVYVPHNMAGTRAYTGDVAADRASENIINSMKIWIFENSTGNILLYKNETDFNLASDGRKEILFNLSEEDDAALLAKLKTENYQVDVYVMVNDASLGLTLAETTTRTTLDELTFDGQYFGLSAGANGWVSSPTSDGLPMSGVLKSVVVSQPSENFFVVKTLHILRAVSKVRFVFSRLTGINDVAITNVSMKAKGEAHTGIPKVEYVFNDNLPQVDTNGNFQDLRIAKIDDTTGYYNSSDGFTNNVINFGSLTTTQIKESTVPHKLAWNGTVDAQTYDDYVNDAVTDGTATELARAYLHESGKQLEVKIYYQIEGENKSVTLTMDATGDFVRNHTWTIYAYFMKGKLYVQPTVLPWIAAHDRYHFSTQGSANMKWSKYLRYDVDKDASTWTDTYVAIAFQTNQLVYPTTPRSPLIILETLNNEDLRLQVDNDSFRFIKVTLGGDDGTTELSREVFGQSIEIPYSEEQVTTAFYLVPVDNNENPTNPYANVTLEQVNYVGPPVNIPFNHTLPGEENHTTIRFFNCTSTTYMANENNIKVNGNTQPYNYWNEENN